MENTHDMLMSCTTLLRPMVFKILHFELRLWQKAPQHRHGGCGELPKSGVVEGVHLIGWNGPFKVSLILSTPPPLTDGKLTMLTHWTATGLGFSAAVECTCWRGLNENFQHGATHIMATKPSTFSGRCCVIKTRWIIPKIIKAIGIGVLPF